MKCEIFICLLSLSVCLSAPNQPEVTPAPQTQPPAPKTDNTTLPLPAEQSKVTTSNETATAATTISSANSTTTNETVVPQTGKDNKTEAVTIKPAVTPETAKANNTTPAHPEEKTVDPSKANTETKPATPDAKKNDTTTAGTNGTSTATTPKSKIDVPTEAPKVVQASRAFDGPSFIGGIILTLGLLAIGFMGFKYYKNQTERNYHTL